MSCNTAHCNHAFINRIVISVKSTIFLSSTLLLILLILHLPFAHSATQSFETSIDYTMHKLATEYNDPSAQYLVGRNFFKGKSVEKNIPEAVKWFEMAAKQGHIRAQHQLGKIYLYGHGVKANQNYAFYYLSKAAEKNNLESIYELGNYYLQGDPKNRQYDKAVFWFRKAAARDHVISLFNLGKLIYQGLGTDKDEKEGKKYLRMAADNGLLEAMDYLSKINNKQQIDESQDSPQLNNKIQIVELDNTDPTNPDSSDLPLPQTPEAQYKLGIEFLTGENSKANLDSAVEMFSSAANQNHAKAQYQLAKLYKQGIGVPQSQTLHKHWLEKAANAGVQSAIRDLESLNIEKSLDTSIAEETKDPESQFSLGLKYFRGEGKKRDHNEAAKWFLKAARQNHDKSQFQLGIMYEKGIGFKQDTAKARHWYKMAANSGLQVAKQALSDLKTNNLTRVESQQKNKVDSSNPASNVISHDNLNLDTDQLLSLKSKPIFPLLKNATNGDIRAQYEIGLKFLSGNDGVEKNINQALKWLKVAANNEHTGARLKLGKLYLDGVDVDRDYRTAASWLEKAAFAGDSEAQLTLGDLYKNGQGVEQNSTTAIMWYRKSANQGHTEARKRLGGCRIC